MKSAAPPGQGGYIDIHTHLWKATAELDEEEMAASIRLARRHGIERVVQLGNVGWGGHEPDREHVSTINTQTLAAVARYPEVFIGFCYLNPSHPPDFNEAEIERCVTRGGMRGIKLWIAVKATDARLDPILRRAGELNVPVLHHAWYKINGPLSSESHPAEIAHLARRFPRVTIVMAHLGGGRERGVLDIAGTPNVVVDTSGAQSEAGLVEYAVRKLGAERVVYGSDWPIRDYATQLGRVRGARISPRERALILRGNAVRILRLEGGGS